MDTRRTAVDGVPEFVAAWPRDATGVHASPAKGRMRAVVAFATDALWLLLIVLSLPIAILLIGMPIALLLFAVVEVSKRLL